MRRTQGPSDCIRSGAEQCSGARHPRRRERGAALLFVLLLVSIGAGLFVTGISTDIARTIQSDTRSRAVLAEVAEVLTSYAVAHATKPGALPCPDTDNDGLENPAPPGGVCPSYIGRLPWLTLGVGDVRDQSGERLWYAVSPNFRNSWTIEINSDTKGDLTVFSGINTATLTIQAVAIIFAPGGVINNQVRDAAPAACSTTGTTIPHDRCADNYLESAFTVNNASPGGPFIIAPEVADFNDRLFVIRTSDFIPIVERRVAGELRRVLIGYRDQEAKAVSGTGCDCYPWPDSDSNGTSNVGMNRGRIPISIGATSVKPHAWGATVTDAAKTPYVLPVLPPYFELNGWDRIIYYAVGRNALQNAGLKPTVCTTCTPDLLLPPPPLLAGTLSVDAVAGNAVVLITPGSAGASRPSPGVWGNYIDDPLNVDSDDRFVTPASKAFDRDRLWTIADAMPPVSCAPSAKTLIKNAPCHTTGNSVKAICSQAVSNLKKLPGCSCQASGDAMITSPCRNSLNPQQCRAAVAALQNCNG